MEIRTCVEVPAKVAPLLKLINQISPLTTVHGAASTRIYRLECWMERSLQSQPELRVRWEWSIRQTRNPEFDACQPKKRAGKRQCASQYCVECFRQHAWFASSGPACREFSEFLLIYVYEEADENDAGLTLWGGENLKVMTMHLY